MGGLKKYMPITFCDDVRRVAGDLRHSRCFVGLLQQRRNSVADVVDDSPARLGQGAVGSWRVTALLTAVYMTRLMVMTFWGRERFGARRPSHRRTDTERRTRRRSRTSRQPHESPPADVGAAGSAGGALDRRRLRRRSAGAEQSGRRFGAPNHLRAFPGAGLTSPQPSAAVMAQPNRTARSRAESHGAGASTATTAAATGATARTRTKAHHDVGTERLFTVISVGRGAARDWVRLVFFTRKPLWPMPTLLENKYYVDEIYDATIINPIETALARRPLEDRGREDHRRSRQRGGARCSPALAGVAAATPDGFRAQLRGGDPARRDRRHRLFRLAYVSSAVDINI